MKNSGTLQATTHGDRELVLTRVFDAPRQKVFDAFSKPELLKKWFGPRGWSLVVCDVDLKVGGNFRFVLRGPEGGEVGMRGVYREIAAPERTVQVETFDGFDGELQVTSVFREQQGKTFFTSTLLYPSREILDAVIQDGIERSVAESYDRLAELLARPIPDPKLDLVLERIVDVSRELVWAAWTKPEHLSKWFTPAPWTVADCEIDLRPGGIFRTTMRSPEGAEFPNSGCYLEVVPNERLVFTDALGAGYRPSGKGFMTAIITLESVGSGTRYTATVLHADEEARKRHEDMGFRDGWGKALDQLVAHVKTMGG
jgi:uncharacterized protein YndB with AHSA1/START domain